MSKLFYFLILLLALVFNSEYAAAYQKETLVSNIKELQAAIDNSQPGSVIVMKNGRWENLQLEFKGEGTVDKPIVLKAEKAGEVFITGTSYLKLGGNYLIVDGLYFKDGYTPKNSVIQFKISDDLIANNSKVINCVIENFTQPDRDADDHWVEFWGRNNTLKQCYIAGKSNTGPTIRVFLKGNEHIKNRHQIVNNHFGPRPRKGGPHGETLQIGDSYTSMTPSYTNVSNNLFDRCNGEVEIISSKSNFNTFSNNVFFESEGSLVLRHGNYATIDANVFIGNDNSENIGGIRVINTGHWITNNYFYKLKGEEFRAPLAVMNGIPKSPLNRYNQVTDVVVAYNTWMYCGTPWNFGVGSNIDQREVLPASEIRSARAERMLLANNLIYSEEQIPILKLYDSIDGVKFENNYFNENIKNTLKTSGIDLATITIEKKGDYFYTPKEKFDDVYKGFDFEIIQTDLFGNSRENLKQAGAVINSAETDVPLVDYSQYGADWFKPVKGNKNLKPISISNAKDLIQAIKDAESGSLFLLEKGDYTCTESLDIDKKLTFKAKKAGSLVRLNFNSGENPAFRMHPNGNLILDGLSITGTYKQDAIRTLDTNMSSAYNVLIKNSKLENFKSILKTSKSSFADTIQIHNSSFLNFENGIQIAQEKDDTGEYNAEFVIIEDSNFENISESVIDYYRGGYDESTIGGNLIFTKNTIKQSGKSDEAKLLIKNRGIVHVTISKNVFKNNSVEFIAILWGEKGQKPVDNTVINSGDFKIVENLEQKLMY
ncbi:chondroitinase-B domain-containing protein [Leeuwenhoekiella sp. MAR_2009_132]|uniref:chondroitinase-B domain-containing protein n=1 Tax=Leeuwenhoekiella sp. MAR_2009_132 TaxID=1392489 RepID=UPI000490B1DC|nr:chondroitinase-B domain-containing protein [Leeuwenhoekiella sp. MAR_2009_132]